MDFLNSIVFYVTALLLAPLFPGVINKTKAFFGGRKGQSFFQAYYDLAKLLRKGAVYSVTTTWVFRAGPIVGLAATATALAVLPMGRAGALVSFEGDLILFGALLALGRMFTVLAALDTGSAFEGMGASREALFSALAEVALLLGLVSLVLVTGEISLSAMMPDGLADAWAGMTAPALAFTVAALFVVMLAENARIPVDDPNTHLELTMIHEVMVLDHSGPDLAYINYGQGLKLWLFASLLVGILLPFSTGVAALDGFVYLLGVLCVAVAIGVVESTIARLRMTHAPNLLVVSSVLGGLGVTLALVVR